MTSPERALVILDSVAAARAWLSCAKSGAHVWSTHMSVVEFLAARGVACNDVSELVAPGDAAAYLWEASGDLDAILAELDSTLGARACAAGGLPRMALFRPAFKYLTQFNLAGMRCFESRLAAKIAAAELASVEFFHAVETSVDPVFSFVDAASRTCAARQVAFAATAVPRQSPPRLRRFGDVAVRALRSPFAAFERIQGRVRGVLSPGLRADVASVLLFEPGDDSYFTKALARQGARLVRVRRDGRVRGSERLRQEARMAAARMRGVLEEWLRSEAGRSDGVARRFVAEAARRARELFEPAVLAHRIAASFPLSAAAWDIPVVTCAPLNLMAEVFLEMGLRVLGRQHGSNYVDQWVGRVHFDSDFDRCTHYFSYGFGAAEFRQAYPNERPRCVFEPGGNPPRVRAARGRRPDIAFPIAGCLPLFYLLRLPEAELVRRQRAVLSAMEARTDLDAVVKPPPNYSVDSFAHLKTLAALRHVRVVTGRWTDFLERSAPRLAVFETASTPLTEVLAYDVDIFLMLDPLFPFTEQALAMLRRRVHVFDTAEALAAAIVGYGREARPKLRDSSYYDTYVNRGSAARVRELLATPAATLDYRLTP